MIFRFKMCFDACFMDIQSESQRKIKLSDCCEFRIMIVIRILNKSSIRNKKQVMYMRNVTELYENYQCNSRGNQLLK